MATKPCNPHTNNLYNCFICISNVIDWCSVRHDWRTRTINDRKWQPVQPFTGRDLTVTRL